ncbi:hypothetical protein HYC85_004069 [Camellia sinensis]|uniref:Protein ENHANCED DISEASE RESISTANCE 2 C-terminal domain-containing protein n=1 Tax=Camellia sinensis TaxID=4442 RepID=A0A7J7HXL7_CAMSI|nr:hypothetical protein HYC85_004069 [Camellia sinensis]
MASSALTLKKTGSEGGSSESGAGTEERGRFEFFGWVYHFRVNSIGHEYYHLRFLFIRGKYVEMYKRDPREYPDINLTILDPILRFDPRKPIRRGVVGYTLMVEELGRRKDVYVLRFYNRLDETKKGEIACATAGEAHQWMEAFDHAKQQAEYELSRGGGARNKLNMETEINLEGHRPRVRRYAHGLRNLIRIGQGPETLLRKSSNLATNVGSDGYFQGDDGDVIEAYEWKCVSMVNGVRIFEDVANTKVNPSKVNIKENATSNGEEEKCKNSKIDETSIAAREPPICYPSKTRRIGKNQSVYIRLSSRIRPKWSGSVLKISQNKNESVAIDCLHRKVWFLLSNSQELTTSFSQFSKQFIVLKTLTTYLIRHKQINLNIRVKGSCPTSNEYGLLAEQLGILGASPSCHFISLIFLIKGSLQSGKSVLVKAVGVVNANADIVFEVILNVDRHQRYEWDMLTGDLKSIDSLNGHYDVVYDGNLKGILSSPGNGFEDKMELIFPTVHKKYPPKSGYRRTEINPSTWEIRSLNTSPASNFTRCLVTQILEIHSVGWRRWKNIRWSKLEKTVPYAMLSQNISEEIHHSFLNLRPHLSIQKFPTFSSSNSEYEDSEVADEFYDAIADDSSSDDEDGDNEEEADNKDKKMKLKNISWAIVGLALKRTSAPGLKKELDTTVPPIILDPTNYHGSMCQGKDETDTNCWTSPSGTGFMIRGKTYLKDNSKVMGGDPLLKLIAVDWFKVENCISKVALHPSSLVQICALSNISLFRHK